MGNASWHKIIIQEAQRVLRTGIQKVRLLLHFTLTDGERFYYVLKRIFFIFHVFNVFSV